MTDLFRLRSIIISHVQSCVSVNGYISDYFRSNLDLMQGEVMSPVLFALFINDIEIYLIVKGCIPYECANISCVFFMYADDLVLFSETVNGLQQMLDCLFEYSQEWGMEGNIEKSKVMVFTNGGKINNADKLYYDGNLVETVDKIFISWIYLFLQ